MHSPDNDLFAHIDRAVFDELRRDHPVYEFEPNTVIVDPPTFERTPKVGPVTTRLPYNIAPDVEALQRRELITLVQRSRARAKGRR